MNDERRKVVQVERSKVRRDMALVAALVSALIGVGSVAITDDTDEVRAAAVKNCEDLVAVETILAERIEKNIKETKETPRSFFPDIPPDDFDRLVDRQIRQSKRDIDDLTPIESCAERFDDV